MNYHNITHDDMLNGFGLRVVLWVSGCNHDCPHCHNPQTHDVNSGISFDDKAMKEIEQELQKDYIDGITFSGGDPLHPDNRDVIYNIIVHIKKKFPSKTIWLYTGYTWEHISNLPLIKYIDVLVDGNFLIKLKDENLHWKGSSNQRVINVQKSLLLNKVILLET